MAELKEELVSTDALAPVADEDITAAHRAWMNRQIEQALTRKRLGTASYRSLEDMRRKFGF